jgi:hypothetical protein
MTIIKGTELKVGMVVLAYAEHPDGPWHDWWRSPKGGIKLTEISSNSLKAVGVDAGSSESFSAPPGDWYFKLAEPLTNAAGLISL